MITTVTMNASIDKAYWINGTVIPGSVMRVNECCNSAGGKGLNVARVIDLCGVPVKATGIVGGHNGDYLLELLTRDGIAHDFFRVSGETRSCINILAEDNSSTEFLEPGFEVTEAEQNEFLEFFGNSIQEGSIITISGSVPKGFPTDIYAKLIKIAKARKNTVLLDTSGDYLKTGLVEKPDFVKPNQEELEALFGIKLNRIEEVIESGKRLHSMGIRYVVISLGAEGAILICDDGCYHGKPKKIKVVNTVGCGDSMVASFAAALERKNSPEDCLAYSVAVSAANALSMRTGYFEVDDLKTILDGVTIRRV